MSGEVSKMTLKIVGTEYSHCEVMAVP